MKSEVKKQKAREKKAARRQYLRGEHLNKARSNSERREYEHYIKFHTDGDEVQEEYKETPVVVDKNTGLKYNPKTTPLDVGTTRMKLEGDVEEQGAAYITEDQLRKELGLG